jgi:hypothetical protein
VWILGHTLLDDRCPDVGSTFVFAAENCSCMGDFLRICQLYGKSLRRRPGVELKKRCFRGFHAT